MLVLFLAHFIQRSERTEVALSIFALTGAHFFEFFIEEVKPISMIAKVTRAIDGVIAIAGLDVIDANKTHNDLLLQTNLNTRNAFKAGETSSHAARQRECRSALSGPPLTGDHSYPSVLMDYFLHCKGCLSG
jgi:hypothetical protein